MSGGEEIRPPDTLVICNPYVMPDKHWRFDRNAGRYAKVRGRRPSGFRQATVDSRRFDDPGIFQETPHVNDIRSKVDAWRGADYPGITHVTRELLAHWNSPEARTPDHRFFFCQLEAIETIIWATEVGHDDPAVRALKGDDGPFVRLCSKMATGTGKTAVMAMLIAWQVINKAKNNYDTRFTRNILVVAPNIPVKRRLQVLRPKLEGNYYEEFGIVEGHMMQDLNRARLSIHNWQTLMQAGEIQQEGRADRRRGVSDEKFAETVLGHDGERVLVINDEAHHAWRETTKWGDSLHAKSPDSEEFRATRWMEGLDRIHKSRTIIKCHDFSATPFVPTGHSSGVDNIFTWIISDFSLDDAVESGLVKTPRMPKADDSGRYGVHKKSEFYHIFYAVGGDLKRRGAGDADPLPPLVGDGYAILASDWKGTYAAWSEKGHRVPPVMITVCNTIKTANRIRHHFETNADDFGPLARGGRVEVINSEQIKSLEDTLGDELRRRIDTVGKEGEPGQDITNVISVDMLTEGWDAHNVTHIMGLRAFESQLLCEQVVGRGLRRKSYDVDPETGLLSPEHVIIFGIPFSFMPMESGVGPPRPPEPIYEVYPVPDKKAHEISWPAGYVASEPLDRLEIKWDRLKELEIDGTGIRSEVVVADSIDGQPIGREDRIRVEGTRLQHMVYRVAKGVYVEIENKDWDANGYSLMVCLVKAVQRFIEEGRVVVHGIAEGERDKYMLALKRNMVRIVQHIAKEMTHSIGSSKAFVHDDERRPVRSTSMLRKWMTTSDHVDMPLKCHLNIGIYDSDLEMAIMSELEHNESVESWVKNDRNLGFRVPYSYRGTYHNYIPDFLVRLKNGMTLVLEAKGAEEKEARAKREALLDWVEAVNRNGRYGTWAAPDMVRSRSEARVAIRRQMKDGGSSSATALCPRCRRRAYGRAEIGKAFGFRAVDGIVRPQSWCKKCRTRSATG